MKKVIQISFVDKIDKKPHFSLYILKYKNETMILIIILM